MELTLAVYVVYAVVLVVVVELFAYCWHRLAHGSLLGVGPLPGVSQTHIKHHTDITDDADDDFVWTALLYIIFELVVGIVATVQPTAHVWILLTLVVPLLTLYWNWWIHHAYHHPEHWLHNYEWFQHETKRHFRHHIDETVNFGIATHFVDVIAGTWDSDI